MLFDQDLGFSHTLPLLKQDVEWGGWVEESVEVGLLGEEGEVRLSELDVPHTLHPEPCTLNPEPCTLNPEP